MPSTATGIELLTLIFFIQRGLFNVKGSLTYRASRVTRHP
jgi:hypothetical protein